MTRVMPAEKHGFPSRRRLARLVVTVLIVIPYLLLLPPLFLWFWPGIRAEFNEAAVCSQQMRIVLTALEEGRTPPAEILRCPATGAEYELFTMNDAQKIYCPGIHRRLTFQWLGFGQGSMAACRNTRAELFEAEPVTLLGTVHHGVDYVPVRIDRWQWWDYRNIDRPAPPGVYR